MGRARNLYVDLKLVLALRALERADAVGEFLPTADRRAWSREAGIDNLPEKPGPGRVVRRLAERARIANGKRLPWSVRPLLLGFGRCDLPGGALAAILVGAFAAGAASLQFEAHHSVNLLGLPLVALLGWNALVYLWLALTALWRALRKPRTGPLAHGVIAWWGARRAMARLHRERDDGTGAWRDCMVYARRALETWRDSFIAVAAPVLRSRVSMALHLAALLWAAGAVAGLYYQGWRGGYHAHWEQDLVEAGRVRTFFSVLFTPASRVTGVAIPLDDLPALRGASPAGASGEVEAEEAVASARPWFHLYAATLGLFVALPRLLLAGWCRMGGRLRLVRAIRAPMLGEYYRQVWENAGEGPASRRWVIVLPNNGAAVAEATVSMLERWGVSRELYNEVELRAIPTEASPEQTRAVLAEAEGMLFGAEVAPDEAARAQLAMLRETALEAGAPKVVFLDAGRFLERFSGLPLADERWRERQSAWRDAVGGDPLGLVVVNEAVVPKLPPASTNLTHVP